MKITLLKFSTLFLFISLITPLTAQIEISFDEQIASSYQGIPVTMPVSGKAVLTSVNETELSARINAGFSLKNLKKNLTAIAEKAVSHHDECGSRLHVKGSNIQIRGNKAIVEVKLQYQLWECVKGVKLFGERIKTKLGSQSGKITFEVTPIANGSNLAFQAKVIDVDASGILGGAISSSSSARKKLIKMIEREMPTSYTVELPEAFKKLKNPQIQNASFTSGLKFQVEFTGIGTVDELFDALKKIERK